MKSICGGNFHLNCLHNAKETTGQTVYEQLQEIMSDVDRTEEANDTGRTALNEIVRLLDNAIIPTK